MVPEEQKKISEVLWSIEDNMGHLQNRYIQLNEFKKHTLSKLLHFESKFINKIVIDSKEIPSSWQTYTFKDILTNYQKGFASGERDENGIIQIRMNNVMTNGQLDMSAYLKVPIIKNIERYNLEKGDILFNNTNIIGIVSLVR